MSRRPQRSRGEAGYILATALVALAVMAILSAVAVRQANSALRAADQAVRAEQALYLANAGVEWALSRTQLGSWQSPHERQMVLAEGVLGHYRVTVERQDDRLVVVSTGTVRRGGQATSRTVEAEIALTPGAEPGPDEAPMIFRQAILANGQVRVENNADICGDIIATGQIYVQNNGGVWGSLRRDNYRSPCESVVGTGKAVSASQVQLRNNAFVEGGWCDPEHWGEGTPCPTNPTAAAIAVPPIDAGALRARADEWWVTTGSQCDGIPEGARCRILPSNQHYLKGSMAFPEPTIIYVRANILLENGEEVQMQGPVTFVVEGQVRVENNAGITCGDGLIYCPIALLVTQDVVLENGAEVHAVIHTNRQFTGDNNAVLYGNVVAQNANLSNNFRQHAVPPGAGDFPPGLVTAPEGGDGGDGLPEGPFNGYIIRWQQ